MRSLVTSRCLESPVFCTILYHMLLLLSHFSRVQLCATPEMAAHQAPPSLGFSRQAHWRGLSFPSPIHETEKWKWKVKVKSFSHVRLFMSPWTSAYQVPPSMGFSRQGYWSGVPLPSKLAQIKRDWKGVKGNIIRNQICHLKIQLENKKQAVSAVAGGAVFSTLCICFVLLFLCRKAFSVNSDHPYCACFFWKGWLYLRIHAI